MLQHGGRRQGIFWLLTIPAVSWSAPVSLPAFCQWIKGQLELGETTGYSHWQVVVALVNKGSRSVVKSHFGNDCHAELSRSSAANAYVWKDDTSDGGRFEFGVCPFARNEKKDWEAVWENAKSGDLDAIPADVRVVSYRTLRAIAADHDRPTGIVRSCYVFWGASGTGKSRRAWDEAGMEAYSKDPRSKFWCGYQNEEHVVIDEFRGGIDIAHLLRWLDRYPVRIEIKGSSKPLVGSKFWITSNIAPRDWYPDCDEETLTALVRRLDITHFAPINAV